MARRSARSWLPWWLGALALGVALGYVISPGRAVIEGAGTVEPVFEDLVVVVPDVSGIVTRMRVSLRQVVERNTPLFEYLPDGQWAVVGYGSTTKPGGSTDPPPAPPEWFRTLDARRLARAEALRHWSERVHSTTRQPRAWERLLEQRLTVRVSREDDLATEEARAAENVRLGRADANLVQTFDRGLGRYRTTEAGQPYSGDAAGMVYSLWVARRVQFSGAFPVAEIMRPQTEIEVFGLVPIPPASLRDLPGWRAHLSAPGDPAPLKLAVASIELGRVPIDAGDARLIFPSLPVTRESVFVRLTLAPASDRERLGGPVLITLTSPARPRLWLWLGGR